MHPSVPPEDAAAEAEHFPAEFAQFALENLFEVSPDAIFVTDASGVIRGANPRAADLFGHTQVEFIGLPIENLVPHRFRARHPAHRENYDAHPRARQMGAAMNLFGLRKDGAEFPVDIMLKPLQAPARALISSPARPGVSTLPIKSSPTNLFRIIRRGKIQTMRETATSPANSAHWAVEFSNRFSPAATHDLQSMVHPTLHQENVILFSEKDAANGVVMVLDGEVKLSINSSDGRRLILRIARRGDILGIASALSGNPHEMTAETLHPCKLAFIGRAEFQGFLLRHPEAYQSLTEELGRQYAMACEQLRTVGLSSSAPEKLARLLLDWSEHGQTTDCGIRFKFSLTHGEIGEFIGTSRETVTRTLSIFKSRRLVRFQGATLTIPNRAALETYAGC